MSDFPRESSPALPLGSRIVITGANGFIASHIADQLLARGYLVRGTVRDPSKTRWLADHFDKTYGAGSFTLHKIAEITQDGAFDDVVDGADGIIHTLAITSLSPDPTHSVPQNVSATLSVLRSAARSPTIRRFVYTSSSGAAAMPRPGVPYTVDPGTYNHQAVEIAYSRKGPGGMAGGYIAYSAAKTKAELELWRWYREEKPGFVLNSIVPNAALGKVLLPGHQGFPTVVGVLKNLWDGKLTPEFAAMFPAQWFCDVVDIARIHIAALLFPDVQSERLIAYADRFNINDLLAVFREVQPDRSFPDDLPDLASDKGIVANERATELMRRLQGGKGWTSLRDCIGPLAGQYTAAEAGSK
ncbi:Putative NAD-dependent epimerase/dehydratase, NAD(P)-binding domain superfamily [Colletotrichum destructivum]|uniref:NAD-dependent epimerase/dehydratase, NAD(P)-binding domain superfamily n=1 Tax=Colletotrichum destructivum TaxID=34406 RepID=A0AAX4IPD9_9PEZI|nr:Putative NAD-dependent epimerase/dehydratase, NAD(P)-binding domain superfamily [Colletotrichum destructivum]